MVSIPPPRFEDRFGNRKPKLLVVGGGAFQTDLVRAAKRLGAEVWAIDRNPEAPALKLADHPLPVDFGDVSAVLALASIGFDGVATAASDAALPSVVACAEAWGLPGTGAETLRLCQDKLRTGDALRDAGLRAPRTRLVYHHASVRPHIDAVGGFPFVIKPRFGAGGRGVSIVESEADLPSAIDKALRNTRAEHGYLVQEFLRGESIGVEAFLWDGRITRGFCMGDQYRSDFVSPIGHSLPPDIDEATGAAVLGQIQSIVTALKATSGPMNFDLRFSGGEVWLIEANARLGGNSITPLVRAAYGVDLAQATVLSALGADPQASLENRGAVRATATRLFLVRGGGELTHRHSHRDWQSDPRVLEFELVPHGEELRARVDEWAIAGRCLVTETTSEAAINLAAEIAADVEAALLAQ